MKVMGKKSDRVLLFDFKEEPMDGFEEVEPTKEKHYIDRLHSPEARSKAAANHKDHLTPMEKKFCEEYVRTSRGGASVLAAGYNVANLQTASVQATALLKRPKIQKEIARLQRPSERATIATATQVMEFFTRMMNGEEKDQFGLELSANDRLKAAMELAKRTIDLENKVKMAQEGVSDNTITIKVDWGQS